MIRKYLWIFLAGLAFCVGPVACKEGVTVLQKKGPSLEILAKNKCRSAIDSVLLRNSPSPLARKYYRCLESPGAYQDTGFMSECRMLDRYEIEKRENPFLKGLAIEQEIVAERFQGGRQYFVLHRANDGFRIRFVESYGSGAAIGLPRMVLDAPVSIARADSMKTALLEAASFVPVGSEMDEDAYIGSTLVQGKKRTLRVDGKDNSLAREAGFLRKRYFSNPEIAGEPTVLLDCSNKGKSPD